MPQLFAHSCLLFDRLAARDPYGEINLLAHFVGQGECACDVGANRGLFTYWLLRRGVTVTAFEPNPRMVDVLQRRFSGALRRGQLRIVARALSDAPGMATLHVPMGLPGLATIDGALALEGVPMDRLKVELAHLDACVEGDIAFIKVDVEGHEVKVFEGAAGILRASRPTILVALRSAIARARWRPCGPSWSHWAMRVSSVRARSCAPSPRLIPPCTRRGTRSTRTARAPARATPTSTTSSSPRGRRPSRGCGR